MTLDRVRERGDSDLPVFNQSSRFGSSRKGIVEDGPGVGVDLQARGMAKLIFLALLRVA
jgi:hypothetical protein